MRVVLAVLLLVGTSSLSGCTALREVLEGSQRPDLEVQRTGWVAGDWTREPVFEVLVNEPSTHVVRSVATDASGTRLEAEGESQSGLPAVELRLPDGTWTVTYWLDDFKWETIRGVRLDTVAPTITGLPGVADAPEGNFRLGDGATIAGASSVRVTDQSSGAVLGSALPVELVGLSDGVHAYDVVATDAAGNVAIVTVAVRVGDAIFLPAGQHTFGIVARYSQELDLWDLKNRGAYLGRAAARAAVASAHPDATDGYLGEGNGILPSEPLVTAAVAEAVKASDNSMDAALALFRWLADHTEYDQERRDSEAVGLQSPAETLQRGEGVCRDLAALYVSLLRAAGVPARLVSGYVGSANVGGFHAWVEFYAGGSGPSPWVPVDVSFDGDSAPATVLQFFAIRPIGNLPMRALTEAQEDLQWFVASQVSYRAARAPTLDFADSAQVSFETLRSLCFNDVTLERRIGATASGGCPGFSGYFPKFRVAGETILDYGVEVVSSGSAEVTAELAFPAKELGIERQSYGAPFSFDEASGLATATWTG